MTDRVKKTKQKQTPDLALFNNRAVMNRYLSPAVTDNELKGFVGLSTNVNQQLEEKVNTRSHREFIKSNTFWKSD